MSWRNNFLNRMHCCPSSQECTKSVWWLRDRLFTPALAIPMTELLKSGCITQHVMPYLRGVLRVLGCMGGTLSSVWEELITWIRFFLPGCFLFMVAGGVVSSLSVALVLSSDMPVGAMGATRVNPVCGDGCGGGGGCESEVNSTTPPPTFLELLARIQAVGVEVATSTCACGFPTSFPRPCPTFFACISDIMSATRAKAATMVASTPATLSVRLPIMVCVRSSLQVMHSTATPSTWCAQVGPGGWLPLRGCDFWVAVGSLAATGRN